MLSVDTALSALNSKYCMFDLFNNLLATELYISAEGITKEGRIIVNE